MSEHAVPTPPLRPSSEPRHRAGRLRHRGESGAAIVEFALVIPIFVLILYGLIFFGMLLASKQSLTNAAADGARSALGAVPVGSETMDQAQIRVAKATVLSHLGSMYNSPNPTVGFCSGSSGPRCITVTVKRNDPPVPPAPGLGVFWDGSKSIQSTAIVQVSA